MLLHVVHNDHIAMSQKSTSGKALVVRELVPEIAELRKTLRLLTIADLLLTSAWIGCSIYSVVAYGTAIKSELLVAVLAVITTVVAIARMAVASPIVAPGEEGLSRFDRTPTDDEAGLRAVTMFRLCFFKFPLVVIFVALTLPNLKLDEKPFGTSESIENTFLFLLNSLQVWEIVAFIPIVLRFAKRTERVNERAVKERLRQANNAKLDQAYTALAMTYRR